MELAGRARHGLIAAGALVTLVVAGLLARRVSRDRVEGHAFDIPSADNRIVVEVLNGSGRNGAARLGTRQLRRRGLDVVYFGNDEGGLVDSTQVLVRRGASRSAERVREALNVGRVAVAPDSIRRVDVTVILGRDFLPDEAGRP